MRTSDADLRKHYQPFPAPEPQHGAFEPLRETQKTLAGFGIPPRPDAVAAPRLLQAWERCFWRGIRIERFKMPDINLLGADGYRLLTRRVRVASGGFPAFGTSRNWSGGTIIACRGRQLLGMMGSWRVPRTLKLPCPKQQASAGTPYACSQWIGLDGQRRYLDSSLPQVGSTAIRETDSDGVTCQLWTQWWMHDADNIGPVPMNLAVDPGDEIVCFLFTLDQHTVVCAVVNLTPSLPTFMAVKIHAGEETPPGYSAVVPNVAGSTAAWVLERPTVAHSTALNGLPDYGQTGFQDCLAVQGYGSDLLTATNLEERDLQGEQLLRMYDVLPSPTRTTFISMPSRRGDTSLRLRYGNFMGQ